MSLWRTTLRAGMIGAAMAVMSAPPSFAVILDVTDPVGDDNGPGNYAYPTNAAFQAGAFDIRHFQIFDDGTTVYFLLQTRNLSPTFGSPLGAQLIDVYLHDPTAAATSTSASFASWNYSIASADAWSRLIEIQGFAAPKFVDASHTSLGPVSVSTNAASNTVEFAVAAAALGHPTVGWSVVVTLTGQDGFSADQARGFTATPGAFTFGVCAVASADPHCTASPSAVPKVIDTITPLGISQSTELDYTLGPVVLDGVDIPAGGTLGAPPSVPEPATGLLFSMGLLAVAALRRRS